MFSLLIKSCLFRCVDGLFARKLMDACIENADVVLTAMKLKFIEASLIRCLLRWGLLGVLNGVWGVGSLIGF